MKKAVAAEQITKKYGAVEALRGVSFDVREGEIFGLVGPDGAGKTTLIRILTTLLLADTGQATVQGMDVVGDYKQIRRIVGYMPGRFSLYEDMTVEENLNFFASVFNTSIEENYELIEDIYVQIEPFKTRRAAALSGGMKQKLALCCALIHRPEVLFLDEPTTGVDPVSRREFWQMLGRLKQQGIAILVSTPYMDEATLCDRIALIQDGRFMQIDTPDAIMQAYPETLWAVAGSDMPAMLRNLRANELIKSSFAFGDVHHITTHKELKQSVLSSYLTELGHTNIEIHTIKPSIEDCYMLLAGADKSEDYE